MADLLKKYGPWALVTGASSGIGEEFSRRLAEQKFNLVLVARRGERLERLADQLEAKHAVEIRTVTADLSASDFIVSVADATDDLRIGLLINNAGYALTGDFLEHRLEDEIALLDVICRAPLILAHHFGRKMVDNGYGGIINVSSASAFLPIPYWSNYSASKAWLMHFSEGLWYELKCRGVDVLALCPGSTQTEFADVANIDLQGMAAGDVVASALRSLGKKVNIVPGMGNAAATLLTRFLTRRWSTLLGSMIVGQRRKQAVNGDLG